MWGRYPETVLRFPGHALELDLRVPLPPGTPARLAELGLGGRFGVVTACNPLGIDHDAAANRRLTAVLAGRMRERYPGAVPATGGSPDGRHTEPGWAVEAPREELRRLARSFLQNALFWFDGSGFLIVPVLRPGPELRLPAPPSSG